VCASSGINFHRLPSIPHPLDKEKNNEDYELMKYEVLRVFAHECYLRVGIRYDDTRKDIRICGRHLIEKIKKKVDYLDTEEKMNTVETTMYLPMTDGVAVTTLPSQNNNRGLGNDRWLRRQLEENQEIRDSLWLSQMMEMEEGNLNDINPTVARAAGMCIDTKKNKIRVEFPRKKFLFGTSTNCC
jgi:hypothetical protein